MFRALLTVKMEEADSSETSVHFYECAVHETLVDTYKNKRCHQVHDCVIIQSPFWWNVYRAFS
jgi:hypothetical protein